MSEQELVNNEAIPVTSEDVERIVEELKKEREKSLTDEEKAAIVADKLVPYRKEGEGFEEYKARRAWANKSVKNYLKSGRMFHISSVIGMKEGMGRTYVKPKKDSTNEQ